MSTFTIRQTAENDMHVVYDTEQAQDLFEIVDADGEAVETIAVPADVDLEPYLEALHKAGWAFVGSPNFDGGTVEKV